MYSQYVNAHAAATELLTQLTTGDKHKRYHLISPSHSMVDFTSCMSSDDRFQQFLDKCLNDARTSRTTLQSFLIMPIQRMYVPPILCIVDSPSELKMRCSLFLLCSILDSPRYKLLLQTLVEQTEENHPDYTNLQKSLAIVR
jgi:hypothetical protein